MGSRPEELVYQKRAEERYVFPISQQSDIEQILLEFGEPIIFPNSINRTVYFDTPDHQVPWGYSLRARNYQPERNLSQLLDPNEEYYVEVKRGIGSMRFKNRVKIELKRAVPLLTRELATQPDTPIRPLIAVEYERRHFALPDDLGRVTLDLSPSYFTVSEEEGLTKLGDEEVVRLETKLSSEEDPRIQELLGQLGELDMFEVISKKIAGLSLYGWSHRATDPRPFYKELKGIEIEAKLVVADQNPFVFFNEVTRRFRQGIGKFAISRDYPFVVVSGSVNSYYTGENVGDNEGVKILARPTRAKAVLKSDVRPITDPHGLGNILRRKEKQSDYFLLRRQTINQILESRGQELGETLRLLGSLERLRKAFWVDNIETGRFYHVSFDRCQTEDREFYQIEVEYTGTREPQAADPEQVAISDIADITKIIVEQFPSQVDRKLLRKIEWLRSNK